MFHLQTIEIQPFKVKCFSTKMLKFKHDDVIIFDINRDFGILFGLVCAITLSYAIYLQNCSKIPPLITEIDVFSTYFFVFFDKVTEISE